MSPRASLALFILLAAATCTPSRAAEPARHVVVLKGGTTVQSRMRPVIAYGQVRYSDESGRVRVLPATEVDVAATRAHHANQAAGRQKSLSYAGTVGTAGSDSMPTSRSLPSVTIYSATWCPSCTSTKDWMASRGVPASVIEVDLLEREERKRVASEMKSLAGRVAYPVVVIGNQVVLGYKPADFTRLLGSGLGPAKGTRKAAPARAATPPPLR